MQTTTTKSPNTAPVELTKDDIRIICSVLSTISDEDLSKLSDDIGIKMFNALGEIRRKDHLNVG